MADHFVSLQSPEQTILLIDYLMERFPPDEVPFSIRATQKAPEQVQGNSDGQGPITIRITGIDENQQHTVTTSQIKAHSWEWDGAFQAARIVIDKDVEQWCGSEVVKAKKTSATSTEGK